MPKSYLTVPDKATGDTFTEGMWDDYVRGNVNNLMTPANCQMSRVTPQTISGATALSWDAENNDTDDMFALGDPAKVYFPTTGLYIAQAYVRTNATLTAGSTIAIIWNNTITVARAGVDTAHANVSAVFSPGAGTFIQVVVYNAGGDVSTQEARLAVCWLGRTS